MKNTFSFKFYSLSFDISQNWWKMQFPFLQKKLWLRNRYQNSTLVLVPDTDTEFQSHTNLTLDDILFRTFWWNLTTLITLISELLVNLHPVEGWIDLSRATFILPASQEWRVIAQKIHRSSINKTSSLPLQVSSVWFNLLGARQCTLRFCEKQFCNATRKTPENLCANSK